MKYAKLKEDWTVILELVRQHKERMAALLVAKKASKLFSKQCVRRCIFQEIMLLVLVHLAFASGVNCCKTLYDVFLFTKSLTRKGLVTLCGLCYSSGVGKLDICVNVKW